jgi:gamma-glutamyltranspeptidase/glutathione hydrolase
MSPTIVLDADGKPVLTVGAAGGPKIITQVLLAIVRYLDFGQTLADAVSEPRLHHQWRPNCVSVEQETPAEFIEGLRGRGHAVEKLAANSGGRTQAIAIDAADRFIGVADPRGDGSAAGP